ncbi:MAG: hypothetical protein HY651_14220 [Acidobacteria bacterium]|nr:hypothetical protein [Acidobacteriota bacterium]
MNPILKTALLNAAGTAAYVIAVASFLFYAPKIFGRPDNSVFIPIAMLLLFVFSAAFTGSLILGRPALWYLDGREKEALSLLFYTLGIFLGITLLALSALFILRAA